MTFDQQGYRLVSAASTPIGHAVGELADAIRAVRRGRQLAKAQGVRPRHLPLGLLRRVPQPGPPLVLHGGLRQPHQDEAGLRRTEDPRTPDSHRDLTRAAG